MLSALVSPSLLPRSHATGETVGIHDNISCRRIDQFWSPCESSCRLTTYPLVIERHVCLRYDHADHAFLSVPGRELVAEFWSPSLPQQDLDQDLVIVGVREHDLIDVAGFGSFV